MALDLWSRWKRLARRAAQVQGQILFFLLYFLVLLPVSLVQPRDRGFRARPAGALPHWEPRPDTPADLAAVRRQF